MKELSRSTLEEMLRSDCLEVKMATLQCLKEYPPLKAEMLRHPDPNIRASAIQVCAPIMDEQERQEAIKDTAPLVRFEAIKELAKSMTMEDLASAWRAGSTTSRTLILDYGSNNIRANMYTPAAREIIGLALSNESPLIKERAMDYFRREIPQLFVKEQIEGLMSDPDIGDRAKELFGSPESNRSEPSKMQIGSSNAYWEFADGVLTISGEGDMPDFKNEDDQPWATFRDDIQSAVICDGVTAVGAGTFAQCSSLKSVTLPDGLTSIGNYAFWMCGPLDSVAFPGTLTEIGNFAFRHCAALSDVSFLEEPTKVGLGVFSGYSRLPENAPIPHFTPEEYDLGDPSPELVEELDEDEECL